MSALPTPLLQVERLCFAYGERPILKDLRFSMGRGEVLAVMGGSGVGKTTILRLLAGLLRPTDGRVEVLGEDLSQANQAALYAVRRRMGLLFQFGALLTDLTCFENVAFPMREHLRLPEPMLRDIVQMKLEAVGLRGAADLYPSEISGGMARRVALARAVALDPQVILYDEPFAGLDPISLGVTARLIRTLNDALGAGSIVVTHDVAESFAIADHVAVLAPTPQGAIVVAHGTPDEMRQSQDPYVQQFLGGHEHGPVAFHMPALPIEEAFE